MNRRKPIPLSMISLLAFGLLLLGAQTTDYITGSKPSNDPDDRTGPCAEGIGPSGPYNYTDGTCLTELRPLGIIAPCFLFATVLWDIWLWEKLGPRRRP